MVWQGLDAVKTGRAMLGATNPLASNPGESSEWDLKGIKLMISYLGTIRGDYALQVGMVSSVSQGQAQHFPLRQS